ncbi:MAG TPA: hypothetical protein VIH27_00185 [Nitrososphaerales archaeon]
MNELDRRIKKITEIYLEGVVDNLQIHEFIVLRSRIDQSTEDNNAVEGNTNISNSATI